jgi:hypothetical protein
MPKAYQNAMNGGGGNASGSGDSTTSKEARILGRRTLIEEVGSDSGDKKTEGGMEVDNEEEEEKEEGEEGDEMELEEEDFDWEMPQELPEEPVSISIVEELL